MKFSYSEVWADTTRLLRANMAIIAALAGVFMFLPALLIGHFLPQPAAPEIDELMRQMSDYYVANWPWLLLASLVGMVGAISIFLLLLGRQGATVGAIIGAAFPLLPFYFLASFLSNLMLFVGFLAFIVPFIYLLGRLAPVGPVVAAEGRRNPIDAIKRAFELTKGRGWAVVGLIILVIVPGLIVVRVITSLLGIVFILVGGERVGGLLALVVQAAGSAAFAALLVVLYAAIYRRLTASVPATAPVPA